MKRLILGLFLIVVTGSARLEGHAFLERADPAVGSTVRTTPGEVRIWLSEKIEPALSTIEVFDASGKQVNKCGVHADHSNQAVLCSSLPPLDAGTYKVVWRVVSTDTHVTKGRFTFRVSR